MTYNDPRDPNDLSSRPTTTHTGPATGTTATARAEGGGMSWLIVGALIVAAGVLAFLYFGNSGDTTAENNPGTATEAPAETGRAATDGMMPAESEPAPAAPAMPADIAPGNAADAPVQPDTPAQPATPAAPAQ
jgi:hypothetical protein